MFRPFRLFVLGVLGFIVYAGFFALPSNATGPGDFDPELTAKYEVSAWQAGLVREDWSAFVNCTLLQRELHRYSWFRAAQTGFALSRVIMQFPHMTARYERVLPGLEEVAAVEKAWKNANFDPSAAAQSQLNGWSAARDVRQPGSMERAMSETAKDYGYRYGLPPEYLHTVASARAEAFRMIFTAHADPDWNTITQFLTSSYATLKTTVNRAAGSAF